MRKVVFGGANSLDNFLAREDNSHDWIKFDAEAMELMGDMWPRFDCMVMGRKTFSVMTDEMSAEDREKVKDLDAGMATYVFSRTLPPGPMENGYTVIDTDPGEFVRELKHQDGKDIMVMGGGEIGTVLLEAGVVDEMGFNIHPVLLGSGIPLFHRMSRQIDLELLECRPMKNGCVYLLYRVK
jgi:dihydrofolate reductase